MVDAVGRQDDLSCRGPLFVEGFDDISPGEKAGDRNLSPECPVPHRDYLYPDFREPVRETRDNVFPEKLLCRSPLKAVLIPRVTNSTETTLEHVSPATALLALGPSTTSQLPYAGNEVMRTASTVVRNVPAFRLNLGRDRSRTPVVISELLLKCQRESHE